MCAKVVGEWAWDETCWRHLLTCGANMGPPLAPEAAPAPSSTHTYLSISLTFKPQEAKANVPYVQSWCISSARLYFTTPEQPLSRYTPRSTAG